MKSILAFLTIFLIVEVVTSWWVWSSQPSHGVPDHYGFSFINYETERLLPWAVVAAILVGLFWLGSSLRSSAKGGS